ncbi:hypothetical protein, partial [Escherichia coli]
LFRSGDDYTQSTFYTAKVTDANLSLFAQGAKATVAKYSVK